MSAAHFCRIAALPGKSRNFVARRNAFTNSIHAIFPSMQGTNEAIAFDESVGQSRAQMGTTPGQNGDFPSFRLVADKVTAGKRRGQWPFCQLVCRSQII